MPGEKNVVEPASELLVPWDFRAHLEATFFLSYFFVGQKCNCQPLFYWTGQKSAFSSSFLFSLTSFDSLILSKVLKRLPSALVRANSERFLPPPLSVLLPTQLNVAKASLRSTPSILSPVHSNRRPLGLARSTFWPRVHPTGVGLN